LTARRDDAGIPEHDMLRPKSHGAQARATDLIDTPGGRFDGQASVDMGLTGRVLALAGAKHLTEDCLGHFGFIYARAIYYGAEDGGTKIMGGCGCE
jgi:hypothetical protein